MHTETRFGFSLSGLLRSCIHTLSTHWSHSGGWVLLGDNIGAESTDFELLVNTTKRSFSKRVYSLLCFWIFSPTLHYQSLIYIYIYIFVKVTNKNPITVAPCSDLIATEVLTCSRVCSPFPFLLLWCASSCFLSIFSLLMWRHILYIINIKHALKVSFGFSIQKSKLL